MCEMSEESIAVFVRRICFWYSKSEPILNGIDLKVKKGSIYGLLGSSGCGKTTLLKCILGRYQIKSGDIRVFGSKPGSPHSHIPGAGVGYMPQELALYSEFTTEEILTYFGKIYAMNSFEINKSTEKLKKLLGLKNKNKLIGNQSGGQQRRISLACALIHSPPLLILDEPTVGTDPVLRHYIWVYLKKLSEMGHTIILTTHYIDEARNASTVAFMRSGEILAEDEPNILLNKYQVNNLEDVFLKLCHSEIEELDLNFEEFCYENHTNTQNGEILGFFKQLRKRKRGVSLTDILIKQEQSFDEESLDINQNDNEVIQTNILIQRNDCMDSNHVIPSDQGQISVRKSQFKTKCSALLHKNYIRITRNWTQLLTELILPSILVMIVLASIGDGPTGINLAIWDEEMNLNISQRLGEVFVGHIDQDIFNLHYYHEKDEAIDSVKLGQNSAAIEINANLTKALRLRFLNMNETNEETIDESQIYVHIDRSNSIIGLEIERRLYSSYLAFVQNVANSSNINSDLLKLPLAFQEPIYGNTKGSLKEYTTPGLYVALTLYVTSVITGHMVIVERIDGLFERSCVAGITAPEFILSIIITQFFIVCLQIVFLLLLPHIVLDHQITGSVVLFVSLLFVQGFCGVTLGLLLGIIFSNLIIAVLVFNAWLIGSIATAGVLWPTQNMPAVVQLISNLMPSTIAVQSLRDIMYRQWSINYSEVYMGFVVSIIWMTIFLIIALIILKIKH